MSSNNNIPSFEEMETMVQDELINLIKEKVNHPQVRFWEPSERITDDEIYAEYPVVYNIFVFITCTTKRNKHNTINIKIGKDFSDIFFRVDLPDKAISALKAFARSATNILYTYFLERDSMYLGKVRFDVLTKDKEHFVIPNLVLVQNIFLYDSVVKANMSHNRQNEDDVDRIPYNEYVETRIEDYVAEQEFHKSVNNSRTNKESS